eukprot:COSAG05_NODE_6693_length_919_cov_1.954878_1_plen_182_part_01
MIALALLTVTLLQLVPLTGSLNERTCSLVPSVWARAEYTGRNGPNHPSAVLRVQLLKSAAVTVDFHVCKDIQRCADGKWAGGQHCDTVPDCADSSDERGCQVDDKSSAAAAAELAAGTSRRGGDGHGQWIWPASMALAGWLEAHPHMVKNKSVLELGCGLGLGSMAAWKLGALRVVATDGNL